MSMLVVIVDFSLIFTVKICNFLKLHLCIWLHFLNQQSLLWIEIQQQQQQQIQPTAKPFQMYKHDDLDGQGDHSNPTQFYYKHLVSGLDPALCTSGGSWSSLHSLVSLTRCYRQYRYSKERERETPSCTGDFNAPPFDDLVEPVNCTWIPYHGRDLFLWKTSANRRDARWFFKSGANKLKIKAHFYHFVIISQVRYTDLNWRGIDTTDRTIKNNIEETIVVK